MFFFHPEIRAILMEYFSLSEADMNTMHYQYITTITKLILDESMLYIEKNNLPENDELNKMLQTAKERRGELKTETALYQYVAKIPGQYPELQEQIATLIGRIDEEVFGDFIRALDEPTAIKILTIMNTDLGNMNNYAEKYFPKKLSEESSLNTSENTPAN